MLTDSHPVEFALTHLHCSQGANMAPTPVRERLCDTDPWEGTKHVPLFAQQEEETSPS